MLLIDEEDSSGTSVELGLAQVSNFENRQLIQLSEFPGNAPHYHIPGTIRRFWAFAAYLRPSESSLCYLNSAELTLYLVNRQPIM